ncbi:coiled-coil domain-containing protein [Sphaerimonospora sp. CA-214678]|uniref:coiled-coil domain-containing protein n=1 Tax=Sphaerimonospora sp. CA-214678 TaxID=3240029 RepID=UPI003D8FA48C
MRSRRRVGLAVMAVASLGVLIGFPEAGAEPDQQTKIRALTREAAAVAKAYRGEIISLDDAKIAVQKASRKVKTLKARLRAAQREVAAMAQTSYMGGGYDGTSVFSGAGDLSTISMMTYLSRARTERLNSVKTLLSQQKKAARKADAEIDKLQKHIRELKSRQHEIERMLARYGFQQPGPTTGLTQRMITVRDAILREFPMPSGYGCLRGGDAGDHGKGRACDFMMSGGGRMPDAVGKARGDALAQWCIDHAREYGIMYIIWQQKFYDMRTGTGWRMMSNRGGITANHYDHVHVSVL